MKEVIAYGIIITIVWFLSGYVMENSIRNTLINKERTYFIFHDDIKVKITEIETTEKGWKLNE